MYKEKDADEGREEVDAARKSERMPIGPAEYPHARRLRAAKMAGYRTPTAARFATRKPTISMFKTTPPGPKSSEQSTAMTRDLKPLRAPIAAMTAANAKPSPSWSDLATARSLYEKILDKKLEWTLHDTLNVPQCLDKLACTICAPYFRHLEEARCRMSSDKGSDDGSENSSDEDGSENSSDEDEMDIDDTGTMVPLPLGDSTMDVLFRLQDIRGKMRVLDWQDTNAQKHQEAGGLAAATFLLTASETTAQQAELSRQLERMQLQLETIQTKWEKLHLEHGGVIAEREEARRERDTARQERDEARGQLSQAEQEISQLRQELKDVNVEWPRKQCNTQLNTSSDTLHHLPSTSPNSVLPFPHPSAPTVSWDILNRMKRPRPCDPPERIAHYLQHHEETNFKGIPCSAPDWTIDMRDVRGYQQVMSRAPPKSADTPLSARYYFGRCVARLFRVLAIPGRYGALLQERGMTIALEESLTECNFGDDSKVSSLSDADIATLLAERGLTLAAADDSWQFCYKYLEAQVLQRDSFIPIQLLQWWETVKDTRPPSPLGLRSFAEDQYIRVVPSKRRRGDRF
ncbi:hypothetical protein B0H12DRAFT_1077798 [Mycena haematopus]|nr:hypothetical protein B0H12DRAFT_1077798 [Mycena haematopus]